MTPEKWKALATNHNGQAMPLTQRRILGNAGQRPESLKKGSCMALVMLFFSKKRDFGKLLGEHFSSNAPSPLIRSCDDLMTQQNNMLDAIKTSGSACPDEWYGQWSGWLEQKGVEHGLRFEDECREEPGIDGFMASVLNWVTKKEGCYVIGMNELSGHAIGIRTTSLHVAFYEPNYGSANIPRAAFSAYWQDFYKKVKAEDEYYYHRWMGVRFTEGTDWDAREKYYWSSTVS